MFMSEGGQVPAGPAMAGFLPARAQVCYQPLPLPSLPHTPDLGTNHPGSCAIPSLSLLGLCLKELWSLSVGLLLSSSSESAVQEGLRGTVAEIQTSPSSL